MSGLWLVTYLLLWLLVGVVLLIVIGMLRQIGELQLALKPNQSVLVTDDGLPIAEPAPPFLARRALDGGTVSFPPADATAVVVFISPTCLPCQELMPAFNRFWARERSKYAFYTICSGSRDQVQEFARLFGVAMPLLPDPDGEIVRLFQHHRSPYGYLVDVHGIVRMKGVINNEATLQALVELRGTRRDEYEWQPVAQGSNGRVELVAPTDAERSTT